MNFENLSLKESLILVASTYQDIVFSSSFGQEDQVILDAIWSNDISIEVFTLDTGRLFPETYELMDKSKAKYKKTFSAYFPPNKEVEDLVKQKGYHSFYESIENRKECCKIRKIIGLKKAIGGKQVWVTGLRAEQSENRNDMQMWEWDEANHIHKFNPLIHWTLKDVEQYLMEHNVPQNSLHAKGFVSIGCQPCTRAIHEGEDARAGRWWWENSQKECGLHQ